MLKKMSLTQDASIPNDLHDMRVEIDVVMDDGTKHRVVCKGPKGTWGMAPLQDADHLVKLQDCFSRALSDRHVDDVLAGLDRIERLNAAAVRDIIKMVATGKKTGKKSGSKRPASAAKKKTTEK